MIVPTVGRVLWYYDHRRMYEDGAQPMAAHVARVWNDRMVNLMVIDPEGKTFSATSVNLVQEGDEIPTGSFCTWMPYQKGQAAKYDELKDKLNGVH